MNDSPAHEVFRDLLGYLESLETQTGAILQFLREKGIATDEQLAPYLEQASSAASVKWRAVRVRMEHLFALSQQVSAGSAPKQASAELPAKTEIVTKESTQKSEAPGKDTEVRRGPDKEPAKEHDAKAVSDNGQPIKDAAMAPKEPPRSSEQKKGGESEHSDVAQQKAS